MDVHVDRTYHQLKVSANSIFLKLREMLNEELDTNKEFMMQSLRHAASEVVAKEMCLLDPVKQAWENSLENINECDKLNNVFENKIGVTVNEIFKTIDQGQKTSQVTTEDAKSELTRVRAAFSSLQNNGIILQNVDSIKKKHNLLKSQVQDSANYMQAATQKFGEIDNSIQDLLNAQTIPQPQSENPIDGLLEQLNDKSLKPLGPSGKTPMRTVQRSVTNTDQLLPPQKSSYTISPIKEIDGNRRLTSPHKRGVVSDHERPAFKSQRIE